MSDLKQIGCVGVAKTSNGLQPTIYAVLLGDRNGDNRLLVTLSPMIEFLTGASTSSTTGSGGGGGGGGRHNSDHDYDLADAPLTDTEIKQLLASLKPTDLISYGTIVNKMRLDVPQEFQPDPEPNLHERTLLVNFEHLNDRLEETERLICRRCVLEANLLVNEMLDLLVDYFKLFDAKPSRHSQSDTVRTNVQLVYCVHCTLPAVNSTKPLILNLHETPSLSSHGSSPSLASYKDEHGDSTGSISGYSGDDDDDDDDETATPPRKYFTLLDNYNELFDNEWLMSRLEHDEEFQEIGDAIHALRQQTTLFSHTALMNRVVHSYNLRLRLILCRLETESIYARLRAADPIDLHNVDAYRRDMYNYLVLSNGIDLLAEQLSRNADWINAEKRRL